MYVKSKEVYGKAIGSSVVKPQKDPFRGKNKYTSEKRLIL